MLNSQTPLESQPRPVVPEEKFFNVLPEFTTHLEALSSAPDRFAEYVKDDLTDLKGDELEFLPGYPPEEQVFGFDSPITLHRFAHDKQGRLWLIKDPLKEKPSQDENFIDSILFSLGKEFGVGIAENQTVEINGMRLIAVRYLPNAVDSHFLAEAGVSETVRQQISTELTRLWVFNFLNGSHVDLQYVFTSEGHVLHIDYGGFDLVDFSRFFPNDQFLWQEWKMDVEVQRKYLDIYRKFIGERLEADEEELERMLTKVESLSDEFIEKMYGDLPEQEKFKVNGEVMLPYRASVIENVKWRRDHIREVFAGHTPKIVEEE